MDLSHQINAFGPYLGMGIDVLGYRSVEVGGIKKVVKKGCLRTQSQAAFQSDVGNSYYLLPFALAFAFAGPFVDAFTGAFASGLSIADQL
jgi:hypothetical protein